MYSFVNHDSHMKMMIRYCAFFCVFFSLFFCAEALCAFSTFSFCLFQAPLLHLHFASNLVVLYSHFKAQSSFFFTHSLLIFTFSYYMKFYHTIIWSSLFENVVCDFAHIPFAIWFNRNIDVVVVCSSVKCHSHDMCQVESLHHIHMCAVDCMVLCFEVF